MLGQHLRHTLAFAIAIAIARAIAVTLAIAFTGTTTASPPGWATAAPTASAVRRRRW